MGKIRKFILDEDIVAEMYKAGYSKGEIAKKINVSTKSTIKVIEMLYREGFSKGEIATILQLKG